MLFKPEKWSFKNSKISRFSKGVSAWFLSKNWFFLRYFLGKLSQKSLLFDVLGRKEYFLHQKSEVLKKSKKSNFSKLLVHGFRQKIEFFFYGYFLGKIRQKRFLFDILDRKKIMFFWPEKWNYKYVRKINIFFPQNSNLLWWVFFGKIKKEKFVFWCSG